MTFPNIIPWNKGLTKETDERVMAYAIKQMGSNNHMWGKPTWCKGLTNETDERLAKRSMAVSKGTKGKKHWFYGKHTSEATKAKQRVANMGSNNPMFGKTPWNKGTKKK